MPACSAPSSFPLLGKKLSGDTLFVAGFDAVFSIASASREINWHLRAEVGLEATFDDVRAYVADSKKVMALDLRSGQQVWTTPIRMGLPPQLAVSDGVVYVVKDINLHGDEAEEGIVGFFTLDAQTADRRW
jgi:outer membrane protein assembly factor BamB